MDFKTATDRLTACPTHDDVAAEAGVTRNTVARARLDPSTGSYRSPPTGWEAAVANLARKRADELVALAEELEG